MLLEQINKRLAAIKDKMDNTHTAAVRQRAKAVFAKGTKTMGIQVEPKLYARILRFKEQRGLTSLKKAVIVLCNEALTNLKIY